MTHVEHQPVNPDTPSASISPWVPWLAWGWIVVLFLAALAELTGWENLRLALDFQRHF